MWLLYALMLGDHRRRVEARAGTGLEAGAAVRLEAAGLSVAGQSWAWAQLTVEELGIRERQGNERRVTYVERLALAAAGRTLVLDALFLRNGRAVLEQAWFRIRALGERG